MVKEDLIDIIAQEGENYRYVTPEDGDTCLYVYEGRPSCLIGRYLVSLGIPVEAFADIEGKSVDDLFAANVFEPYGVTADYYAAAAMGGVQNHQDMGQTWGYSYNAVFDSDN
jgi:hypothetical protein